MNSTGRQQFQIRFLSLCRAVLFGYNYNECAAWHFRQGMVKDHNFLLFNFGTLPCALHYPMYILYYCLNCSWFNYSPLKLKVTSRSPWSPKVSSQSVSDSCPPLHLFTQSSKETIFFKIHAMFLFSVKIIGIANILSLVFTMETKRSNFSNKCCVICLVGIEKKAASGLLPQAYGDLKMQSMCI